MNDHDTQPVDDIDPRHVEPRPVRWEHSAECACSTCAHKRALLAMRARTRGAA